MVCEMLTQSLLSFIYFYLYSNIIKVMLVSWMCGITRMIQFMNWLVHTKKIRKFFFHKKKGVQIGWVRSRIRSIQAWPEMYIWKSKPKNGTWPWLTWIVNSWPEWNLGQVGLIWVCRVSVCCRIPIMNFMWVSIYPSATWTWKSWT